MYIFFQADTEEERLSYYQMRQPGTIYLTKDLIKFRIKNSKIVKFRITQRMILNKYTDKRQKVAHL